MNILVSGANGLLGTTFRKYKDNNNNYIFKTHQEFDITNEDDIEKNLTENIDVFINCAAYTNVDKGEIDNKVFDINNKSIDLLASQCKKNNILFVHFSSDYIFSGDKSTPYTEDDTVSPLNNYGISKVLSEFSLKSSGCSYIIFRVSGLYAEFGKNFVTTIANLIKTKEQICVVNDQIETPTYTVDIVRIIKTILSKIDTSKQYSDVYHLSNEGICSFYDFAYFINKYMKVKNKIIPCSTSEYQKICSYKLANRPKYSVLDKSKIKNQFNIDIPHWTDSLHECIEKI